MNNVFAKIECCGAVLFSATAPPLVPAVLSAKTDRATSSSPPSALIAPPVRGATLREKLTRFSFMMVFNDGFLGCEMKIAPPSAPRFPLNVEELTETDMSAVSGGANLLSTGGKANSGAKDRGRVARKQAIRDSHRRAINKQRGI